MLLREDGDAVIAIGQASHAWISGQLARAWRPAPEPFEEVCLAAEQHDTGMAEWDLLPTLNPDTGLPHTFLELPLVTHIALWNAAPVRLLTQSRYAALLVSMHGTALQELRDPARLTAADRDRLTGFLERQCELQAELTGQLGVSQEQLARNQRLVWAWDSISLALCLRWPTLKVLDSELALTGEDAFTLRPWPFDAEQVAVRCEGRRLHDRFVTERELHAALERAQVVQLEFTIRPSRIRAGSDPSALARSRQGSSSRLR